MNNRRQTIWLVSMLSLMVILSAYYLFTEDANPTDKAVNQEAQSGAQATGDSGYTITQIDSTSGADGAANSPDAKAGGTTDDAIASGEDDGTDAAAGGEPAASAGKTDEEVIEGMTASLTGRAYFDDAQLRRMESFDKEAERLNAIIADGKNATADEAATAVEELDRLDSVEQKITSLEEKLTTNYEYENAVVEEEDSNYKVVVQADKLDKSQAVTILDLAVKELGVAPSQLTVQYIPNP
ncbi:SpoIIIAH-like family protein [Cohnella fermenti]|nr:SpoIIIAH-like family protein [Cohnella fermenti]